MVFQTTLALILFGTTAAQGQEEPPPRIAPHEVQEQLEEAIDRVLPAFVRLSRPDQPLGGGVLVDPSGLIVTHGHHELELRDHLTVTLSDGQQVSGEIRANLHMFLADISVIALLADGPWPCLPAKFFRPAVGDDCFMLGYPLEADAAEGPLVRLGTVSSITGQSICTTIRMSPGDSGSPLFDLQGRVVGVANRVIGGQAEPSFCANVERVFERLKDFSEQGLELLPDRVGRTTWTVEDWPELTAASRSVVTVSLQGRPIAQGLVVREDGWVASKSSLLDSSEGGKPVVLFADGRRLQARAVYRNLVHDVVLLKVDVSGLEVPEFQTELPYRAQLVATPLGNEWAVRGVITTGEPRAVPAVPGSLDVEFTETEAGLVVKKKAPSGAPMGSFLNTGMLSRRDRSRNMLRVGDVLLQVGDQKVKTAAEVRSTVEAMDRIAGTTIPVKLRRDDQQMLKQVVLSGEDDWRLPGEGELSRRRSGFPQVFGHDTTITARECGGPLCDLEGRVLGLIIARARRHESLTISAETLLQIIERGVAESDEDR